MNVTTAGVTRDRPAGAAVRTVLGSDSWLRHRRVLVDTALAAGVFLYNAPIVPAYADGASNVAALLVVSGALCGSYLLRHRHPTAVLAAMLLAASIQVLLGTPLLVADVMLLFGVGNLAARRSWTTSIAGAALALAWLLVATVPQLGRDVLDVGQLGVLVVITLWAWTWGVLVRTRQQNLDALRERAEQAERRRDAEARIAVADERARIAREIHDVVSHGLSVVVLMSDGAAAKVDTEPARAKTAMLHVRDTGRTALADMRRMLGVLRQDEPGSRAPQPGIAQLDALIEHSRVAGLPARLTVHGDPATLSDGLGLTTYRLVQESLTNAHKHAGPDVTRVDVQLVVGSDDVEIRITDDGRGPSAHPEPFSRGHGLDGMRERVAAHGGALRAGPRGSGGFEVIVVLPRSGDAQ